MSVLIKGMDMPKEEIVFCITPDGEVQRYDRTFGHTFGEKFEAVPIQPPANQWIPCSERLPEMECNVLIWTRSGHYEVAHLDIQEWTEDTLIWYPQYNRLGDGVEWYMEEVLAWQPLPSPYGRRRK